MRKLDCCLLGRLQYLSLARDVGRVDLAAPGSAVVASLLCRSQVLQTALWTSCTGVVQSHLSIFYAYLSLWQVSSRVEIRQVKLSKDAAPACYKCLLPRLPRLSVPAVSWRCLLSGIAERAPSKPQRDCVTKKLNTENPPSNVGFGSSIRTDHVTVFTPLEFTKSKRPERILVLRMSYLDSSAPAIVEHPYRSHLRDSQKPQAIDSSGRKHRDDGPHRTRKDARGRRKSVVPMGFPSEKPEFVLDMVGQPPKNVRLGTSIQISTMLSLRLPDWSHAVVATEVDTSRLIAAVSLIATPRTGEAVPLEAGIMVGQQMFDSVHAIPESCRERVSTRHARRLALGFFTFSGLMVRQAGIYSIRVTLIDVAGSDGSTSILNIDSEQVKVEHRIAGAQRRRERVQN
nr:hypothetical protein CFP56_36425 [Quercus suber]